MANDYISRDAAVSFLQDLEQKMRADGEMFSVFSANGVQAAISAIKTEPAADVTPVVRCKECKHAGNEDVHGFFYCRIFRHEIGKAHFCSYGARMDKEAT